MNIRLVSVAVPELWARTAELAAERYSFVTKNEWLQFERMRVYVRTGPVAGLGLRVQLANLGLPAEFQRQGCFTRLVASLAAYPLYLENVLNPEWAAALVARHGWRYIREGDLACLAKEIET